jgi:RNA polymerase sigma factor (sigma-70 family)
LAALPPRQQEVLRLSRHGYKPAQIARALAISPNTVRVNLFHARKRIRQLAGAA